MGKARLSYLLERYSTNTCTREEMEELFRLSGQEDAGELLRALHGQWEQSREMNGVEGIPSETTDWDGLFRAMMEVEPAGRRRSRVRSRRVVAGLSLCLLLLAGAMLVFRWASAPAVKVSPGAPVAGRFRNDVQPGGNKAVLTLADGSSIVLDSASDGTLSTQGHTRVLKLPGGRLAYQATHGADDAALFNTISTPRGGQYQIELPDGSRVWLDASSSLRFPTSFTGREREVQLSGEAYFEVAGNPSHPFAVSIFSREPGKSETLQRVQVLGTQFNVMAYADEGSIKTTLLEGAVRIDRDIDLKPGEQAQLTRDRATGIRVIDDADVDAAVAWKNGYFNFNKADIQTIMRQLSRWYDIDVSFRGDGARDRVFYGGIQRNLPLSSVFRILERSGVQFSIDGKKVAVDL